MRQIFTFGRGQEHKGKYVVIDAPTREDCRTEMIRLYGMNWAYIYEAYKLPAIINAGLTELK